MRFGKARIQINLKSVGKGLIKKKEEEIKAAIIQSRKKIVKTIDEEYNRALTSRRKMNRSLKSTFKNLIDYDVDDRLRRVTDTGKLKMVGKTRTQSRDFFIIAPRLKKRRASHGNRLKDMSIDSLHGLWHIHEYGRTRDGKTTIYPKGKLLAFPHRNSRLPSDASPKDYDGQWVDVIGANYAIFVSRPKKINRQTPKAPRLTQKARLGARKPKRPTINQIKSGQAVTNIKRPSAEGGRSRSFLRTRVRGRINDIEKGEVLFIGIPNLPVREMTKHVSSVGPFQKAMNSTKKRMNLIIRQEFQGIFGKRNII